MPALGIKKEKKKKQKKRENMSMLYLIQIIYIPLKNGGAKNIVLVEKIK